MDAKNREKSKSVGDICIYVSITNIILKQAFENLQTKFCSARDDKGRHK
jgi:hypothetical protein